MNINDIEAASVYFDKNNIKTRFVSLHGDTATWGATLTPEDRMYLKLKFRRMVIEEDFVGKSSIRGSCEDLV